MYKQASKSFSLFEIKCFHESFQYSLNESFWNLFIKSLGFILIHDQQREILNFEFLTSLKIAKYFFLSLNITITTSYLQRFQEASTRNCINTILLFTIINCPPTDKNLSLSRSVFFPQRGFFKLSCILSLNLTSKPQEKYLQGLISYP